MAEPGPLSGRGILITRAAHQAQPLIDLVRAAGGEPIAFPALEIRDVADQGALNALIGRLDSFDLAVFISPNAVAKAMNLIQEARGGLPARLAVAAIGRGSARELKRHGIAEVLAPAGRFDSEALLELPALRALAGKFVVIFRGEGGRELLGDVLTQRGARVEYAECYRRARPQSATGDLLRRWSRGEIAAVTVTSAESLRNLYDMLGKLGCQWLKTTPLFAPHPHIADVARQLGVQTVVVTEQGDEGLVTGLAAWFSRP